MHPSPGASALFALLARLPLSPTALAAATSILPGGRSVGCENGESDGAVSADEIRQFKSYFGTDQYPLEDVASVFREAVSDGVPIYQAARTLADVAADPSILEQVLIGLIGIASVDGVIHDGEAAAIRDVGRAFSVTADRVELLLNAHGPKAGTGQSSANQKHRTRKPKTPSPECLNS
ncbi:MAG: TerB family tellurite resistance protein [Hyphomonadaceae bacterium]|nr:TerB family tellurite resistance protein [Hyphomonadaceae bacterium]